MLTKDRRHTAELLCNLSLAIYLVWLLLPTLQQALHSWPGLVAILLLGIGMVIDSDWLGPKLLRLLLSVVCILALAFAGALLLRHGVNNTQSFLVSRCMFFYPIILAAYFFTSPETRLWKGMHGLLITLLTVTALITLFWNVEGFFNRLENGSIRTYSRLIYDRKIDEATIAGYNLRGIGSLPFIYALTLLIPVVFIWIENSRGKKRLGYVLFLLLAVGTIFLAQFTFTIVFVLVILWVELVSLLIKKISAGRLSRGFTMLLALVPLLVLLLFLPQITNFAFTFAKKNKLSFIRYALKGLHSMTQNGLGGFLQSLSEQFAEICKNPLPTYTETGEWYDPGRIALYMMSLSGFVKSPWIGSLAGGQVLTGYHSDLLDALSACGLLGTALLGAMFVYLLWDCLKAMRRSPHAAHFGLVGFIALLLTIFTTYLCCREISAVFITSLLLLCRQLASWQALLHPEKCLTRPEGEASR